MSGDLNLDFKGLSGDEELEKLLESVRRDIGEASPEAAAPSIAEDEAAPEPEIPPERPVRAAAPQARQLRQPRPQGAGAITKRDVEEARARMKAAQAERPMPPERERIKVVRPEEEQQERRGRFGLAFGIYTAVLFLLLAAACAVLWFYLDAYEATRPEGVMDEFTELAGEDYWASALEDSFTVGETPFEDRDELMEELCLGVLRDNPLEYREDADYSESNMVYLVSAGGRDVCRVTLEPVSEGGNAGFGFTYLAVTRVELLAGFTAPESHEISITAPADAEVFVNGVAVTDEYIDAEAEVESSGLSELEEPLAGELMTVYRIGGIYAPVEVAAGIDGEALEPEGEAEGASVSFPLGEGGLSYRILVPAGSSVSVNGVELGASYNTGDTVVPALLEGFDAYGALPELELWLIEGLHAEPEISAEAADGSALGGCAVDGGELVFFGPGDSVTEGAHSSEAREFVTAYVNYLSGEAAADADYTALQAKVLDGSALDAELAGLSAGYEPNGLSVEKVSVRSGSFVPIGSTCYVCTVDVDYAPAEDGGEDVSTAYTVVFVMYGGVWQAAEAVC